MHPRVRGSRTRASSITQLTIASLHGAFALPLRMLPTEHLRGRHLCTTRVAVAFNVPMQCVQAPLTGSGVMDEVTRCATFLQEWTGRMSVPSCDVNQRS